MTLGTARDIWTESNQLVNSMLFGREQDAFAGAAIDTRSDCRDKLFFALRGERTDGHRFSLEAAHRGGKAIVIAEHDTAREAAGSNVPYFMVKEPLAALQDLSRAYRATLTARIVAVTGSSGKTTTKELIRRALLPNYSVHSNPGNYNNHIGVPLTILDTARDCDVLVSEVGANHAGEIAFLCDILRPDTAVITNIGDAHVGHFGSRENIADAKAELLDSISESGLAVLPGDDEFIEQLKNRSRGSAVTFGFNETCDYRVSDYRLTESGSRFCVNGRSVSARLMGRHNALNIAAALAVSVLEHVEWNAAVAALEAAEPLEGRGKLVRGAGITMIDDAYNANPSSMRASLAMLQGMTAGRTVAILGDMKELGAFSEELHRNLGEQIAAVGLSVVWWFGEEAGHVRSGLESAGGGVHFRAFSDLEELTGAVTEEIRSGDAVLVKGSHSCRLDLVVRAVRAMIENAGRT
jgi:UDP-N-acetylmuramoyl-tripeptide--D-alanyl-D-alanine ligase